MEALIAGLYVGHTFFRVLKPTSVAHFAMSSLPVPADRHAHWLSVCDFCSSPQCGPRLLDNVVWSVCVGERFDASEKVVVASAQVNASKTIDGCGQVTADPLLTIARLTPTLQEDPCKACDWHSATATLAV